MSYAAQGVCFHIFAENYAFVTLWILQQEYSFCYMICILAWDQSLHLLDSKIRRSVILKCRIQSTIELRSRVLPLGFSQGVHDSIQGLISLLL